MLFSGYAGSAGSSKQGKNETVHLFYHLVLGKSTFLLLPLLIYLQVLAPFAAAVSRKSYIWRAGI